MGLLDEALEMQDAAKPVRCLMCKWLAGLDDDTRTEWDGVAASREVNHATLKRLLERHGCNVSESAVKHHRRHSGWQQ